MAEQKRKSLERVDLQALPAPALQAVVTALKAKGGLLRTSTVCRDAVLAACKVATLQLHANKDQSFGARKAHQPLLERLCKTASPGLKLCLEAEPYALEHDRKLPMHVLLASEPPLHLPNVHELGLQGWVISWPLPLQSLSLPQTFPNLRSLSLTQCGLLVEPLVSTLHHFTQLTRLQFSECHMSPSTARALSSLTVLSQLQQLGWYQPEQSGQSEVQGVLGSVAQLTQLSCLVLGYNVDAGYMAPLWSLITAATKMVNLQSLQVDFVPKQSIVWDYLRNAHLQYLLNSYHTLTTLAFNGMVLDQAGLDLLLAHPHVVNVTFLAIAATESRLDSPCSWKTLTVAKQVDVRTAAYVPLHSLTQPLQVGSLQLPPDVATEQLPHLLQAATTRMAAHKHLFTLRQPAMLIIEDWWDWEGPGPAPGEAPAVGRWTPDVCSALYQAVVRLAVFTSITGIRITVLEHESMGYSVTGLAPVIGAAEVSALSRAWGNRLQSLALWGFQLADGFIAAVLHQLPGLQSLTLPLLHGEEHSDIVAARFMALCSRVSRPLKLGLPPAVHKLCCSFMSQLAELGGCAPLVELVDVTQGWDSED